MVVPSMAPHLGHVIANTFECGGGSPLQFSWRATTYVIARSQIGHFASLITLFHLLIQDVLATFSQELKDFALFLSRRRRRGCSVLVASAPFADVCSIKGLCLRCRASSAAAHDGDDQDAERADELRVIDALIKLYCDQPLPEAALERLTEAR
jgi:hypothetical protein